MPRSQRTGTDQRTPFEPRVLTLVVALAAGWFWPPAPPAPAVGATVEEFKLTADDTQLTSNATVARGVYAIRDANENGVVHIQGQDLTIDFQGATLDGSNPEQLPDEFAGRGIVIEDATNVVIKNLIVRGFKIGIYARNCRGLRIEGCDVSDNWKAHLHSTPQAEDGADWLFGHENDHDEWFRYGAGIYLDACQEFTLAENKGRRGQNGACLVKCERGWVHDNDMSFNSGWGLALYRTSQVEVAHNKFDWCIRGYSHGVYNRGQDSAGILVFEQCCDNVFAYNSATHGGDGFFLFAGLETLDETGRGGCNRNVLYRNDFSHASNNGIEATFSDGNQFIENTLDQADHAIWGGYSYNTRIVGNHITRCNHGISIEHGSKNWIEGNDFTATGVAINVWANERSSFADKPYGRDHHCRSENYTILRNQFRDNKIDVRLGNTSDARIEANDFLSMAVSLEVTGHSEHLQCLHNNFAAEFRLPTEVAIDWKDNFFRKSAPHGASSRGQEIKIDFAERSQPTESPKVHGKQDAFLPPGTLRGLEYILVDDWGPFDFSRVKLVPEDLVAWESGEIRVLGPPTPFSIRDVTGEVEISPRDGMLPATLKVTSADRQLKEFSFSIDLPERKEQHAARGLLLFAEWDVAFYGWKYVGPQKPPADWRQVLSSKPLEQRKLASIDFRWGGGAPSDTVPADLFGTVATTELELPQGSYEIGTISDDGVRVEVDGQRVIDNWTWHPPAEDKVRVDLQAGKHSIRIDHFEIDGVAQLQFWIRPVRESAGTKK